ncbi:23 kDa integral membrane protein-like [Anthonomus grandis grandis]|uniref:23 kDa integral membrane protein-like n=1 Tax=Anthonomus grandis grandis TaxID=2921223 RepID=UPI002166B8F5|nr:23 kDa integral membrane protein-like [Anthonomus grandis grandis]
MCFTETFARIFMFAANFAFLLVGIILLALGIFVKLDLTKIVESIPEQYQGLQYVPILAIIVGVIIFVISFLGCCGTLKSNTCMLQSYAGILILIFVVQVAIGSYGLVKIKNTDDLRNQVDKSINKLFDHYSGNSGPVNFIQSKLKCCGTFSPAYWTSKGQSIPASCYEDSVLFSKGCCESVFNLLKGSVKSIAITAIVISVTEVLGAILAVALANCINLSGGHI